MSTDIQAKPPAKALDRGVYQAVMDYAPWPMVEVEGEAHLVRSVNPAFCQLLSKQDKDILGKPLAELVPQDKSILPLLDRVSRSGEAEAHVEAEHRTPRPVFWSYTCWPIQAGDTRRTGLMIQVTETSTFREQTSAINEALLISAVQQHELTDVADRLNVQLVKEIAEREKAEAQVRAGDERLRVALASAGLGTWNLDPVTGLFSVDERYQMIFGGVGPEFTLQQGIDAIHPDDKQRVAREVEAVMRGEGDGHIETEYRVLHPDGSLHWVLSKGRAEFSAEGVERELQRFAGTVADITERRRMELALIETATDLAEVDRHKSEFLATLAHELRNPLAPMRNGLELLAMARDDQPTWDQTHAMMTRQMDHMVRLIDELMDLSRISRGVIDLRNEQFDLRAVLEQAMETSRSLIEQRDHRWVLDLPDEPVMVNGDSMRLTQVFGNLLNNAAKYTDRGGDIALRAEVGDGEVRVMVEDNGIGIAPDQQEKVFDMFAQVERANERVQGGIGIGLNIVKHLVEMHHGRIEVRSGGEQAGSTFTVVLPLAPQATADVDRAKPSATATVAPMRILIVDDNEDAATMMAMLLGRLGHEVRVAHNGQQALEEGELMKPSLVLMDIGMPVMNGNVACQHMKRTAWGRAAYVVALTGLGQDEDRRKTSGSGFDHHLVKPVGSAVLTEMIVAAERKGAK